MSDWPFEPLKMFGYDVVEIDPPTTFELRSEKGNAKSASAQYSTMSWDALAELPVGHLARADAIMLLWACAPTMPQSLELMRRWGANYKTHLIWRKTTVNGKVRMGTGYRARSMHEIVLLGAFGGGGMNHLAFPSLFDGIAREHSRKPSEFYDIVRAKTPTLTRCALFARQTLEGFDCWGDEGTKFDCPPHPDPALVRAVASLEG